MKGYSNRLGEVQEYYFSKKLKEVQQLREAGRPIINMGIGSPDLPPDPRVTEALKRTADLPNAHGYQSYQGIPRLREAMADFYVRNYGVSLDPQSEILPLMGSKEGIMHISMAFLNEGDEVLIPNPGYPTYTSVTRLLNAHPVYFDLLEGTQWEPDWEALENRDLSRVKLMWVNYPHMPTGAPGSKELFGKLLNFVRRNDILLVHDNPYSFILNEQPRSILELPEAKNQALELNSLSKTFNIPGWRVGMVAGRQDYLQAVLRVKSNMDSGMFLGIQEGAICALNLDTSWTTSINDIYKSRKSLVLEMAERLGLQVAEEGAGMFVWAKVPPGKKALNLVDRLLYEKDIFITPGEIFGSRGEAHVRFSLCVDEQKIKEALNRLVNYD
ncbi:pyridoxal phosphate-dependent aminotransferase [Cyclobacterium xiamenense]|uniref:pyridoxal phosphate-dependent aminotransferase n=1 Tax=Cyclobacterium xiamenense TaxID=1297121 RepID=UPI0035CFAED3